jgi:hypothetical protein
MQQKGGRLKPSPKPKLNRNEWSQNDQAYQRQNQKNAITNFFVQNIELLWQR